MLQAVASCGCGCIWWSYQSNPSFTLALQVRLLVLTSETSEGGSYMNIMVMVPPRFGSGASGAVLCAEAKSGANIRPPAAPNKTRRVGSRLMLVSVLRPWGIVWIEEAPGLCPGPQQ